jgi:hypothetical protein
MQRSNKLFYKHFKAGMKMQFHVHPWYFHPSGLSYQKGSLPFSLPTGSLPISHSVSHSFYIVFFILFHFWEQITNIHKSPNTRIIFMPLMKSVTGPLFNHYRHRLISYMFHEFLQRGTVLLHLTRSPASATRDKKTISHNLHMSSNLSNNQKSKNVLCITARILHIPEELFHNSQSLLLPSHCQCCHTFR